MHHMNPTCKPLLTAFQLLPLLVERYMPQFVPTKISVPITAKEKTVRAGESPLFTKVQIPPLLEDKKTPRLVAAKILVPEIASELMTEPVSPLLTAVQLIPLFVD